jgi:hypothetical protein
MTMRKVLAVSALVLGATFGTATGTLAQVYYYGYYGPFGYSRPYQPNYHPPYWPGDSRNRGGPGPRVGQGTGMGIGAER